MAKKKQKRFTVEKKIEVALELIKGASLEEMSRKAGRPAHEVSQWKDLFFEHGKMGLKAKSTSDEDLAKAENKELKAKIGELVMNQELLEEKIDRLEGEKGPLAFRRSKK